MAVQTQILHRRGTAATWTSTNPTLGAGEIGYETDTGKYKIGTGSAVWTSLAYASILPSTVTAKGDILAASAASTPAALAVGNNGETIVADSSTSTGLRYQGHIEAGKNAIINGNFDIWQRGTSSGSAGYQTADRWYENASNSTTFARESTTVPTGSTYCFKMTAGATAQMWIQQAIETLNAVQFAGQTITASAQVQASVSTGMSLKVFYSTTVDNPVATGWTEITATSGGTATATSGSFTTLSGIFAIPSTAKSILMQIITTSTVASGVIVYVGKAQLELGSVVTTFSRAGGTMQGELAACQRYYWRYGGDQTYQILGYGVGYSTTDCYIGIKYPVTMRTVPSSIDFSTLTVQRDPSQSLYPVTALANLNNNGSGKDVFGLKATIGSASLSAGTPYNLLTNGSTSAYLGFSAEL